jgi:putative FmdB family regulatory protein
MPIYEFYCSKCNTIYNFFSKSVNTEKIPRCPKCRDKNLSRQVSVFANISMGRGEEGADGMPPIDEGKMEKAMAKLAGEAARIDENDPKQAAVLMRKLSDATGLNMGPAMEEALRRMEHGEDPDTIEAEMGDLLEEEEPFTQEATKVKGHTKPKPQRDDTLYDL